MKSCWMVNCFYLQCPSDLGYSIDKILAYSWIKIKGCEWVRKCGLLVLTGCPPEQNAGPVAPCANQPGGPCASQDTMLLSLPLWQWFWQPQQNHLFDPWSGSCHSKWFCLFCPSFWSLLPPGSTWQKLGGGREQWEDTSGAGMTSMKGCLHLPDSKTAWLSCLPTH